MKKIHLSESSKQDLIDGYHFYESQEFGLDDYFLDSLYADIDSLVLYAGVHQRFFDIYYRQLSIRFPFAIYYTMNDNEIYVKAVLDCRRRPSWIKDKVKL